MREAAVKSLVSRPQRGTLPMLLVRLNDWVPQVRVAANAAVRSLMQPTYLVDWITAIDAVVDLERTRRADHAPMLKEISLFLSRPEHLPQVIDATRTAGLRVRRFVFDAQWLAAQDDDDRVPLLERALSGDDVLMASRAVSQFAGLTSPERRRHLYQTACATPFAAVRHEAVRWLVENPDDATDGVVRAMDLDANSHVRWWCLRWLRSNGGVEHVAERAAEVASDELKSTRLRRAAMQWLLDIDPGRASAVSDSWLDSPWPRLRRDALLIRLVKSDADGKAHWLQQAFADPSPRVQKLLLDKAHRGAWVPPLPQLLQVVQRDPTIEKMLRVLSIRSLYPVWDRLECLLALWPMSKELGKENLLIAALAHWPQESRSYCHGPGSVQAARLAELWSARRQHLDAQLQQTLDFHLRTFGVV
ncbi:hypothetical protein ACVC7V_24640 [Hydrogenophaga sp. A37]